MVEVERLSSFLAVVEATLTLFVCSDEAMLTLLPDDTRVDEVVEECSSFTVGLLLHLLLFCLCNTLFKLVNSGKFSPDGVFFC